MSDDHIIKSDYFKSSIYNTYKPEWVDQLNNLSDRHIEDRKIKDKEIFKNRNKKFKKDIGTLGHSYHSNNLVSESDFAFFNQYIGETAREILDEQGYDLQNHILIVNETWVQEFTLGGHHRTHVHPNNHISGFYYLKCSENTSIPIFNDPRPAKIILDLPEKNNTILTNASPTVVYKPRPGDMYFFNSYLTHEYSFDFGVDPFRFMHFNIQAVPRIDV